MCYELISECAGCQRAATNDRSCGRNLLLLGWCVLTAFLATSPGGLDSVAIIAIGTHSDVSFVLAVQTLRLLVVIVTGPMVAK